MPTQRRGTLPDKVFRRRRQETLIRNRHRSSPIQNRDEALSESCAVMFPKKILRANGALLVSLLLLVGCGVAIACNLMECRNRCRSVDAIWAECVRGVCTCSDEIEGMLDNHYYGP
ncbi:uncharacterized protein LOC144103463 [Amblyomma americanum]